MNMRWLQRERWAPDDYVAKAFCVADITPPTGGGLLQPEQAQEFIRMAMLQAVMLKDANVFTSRSPKFEVPRISLANRVLYSRAGLADCARQPNQTKPATGLVTMSTVGYSGEVAVCDDVLEDNIELGGLADTLAEMIAEAVGRDIEEIAIKSDTARLPAEDATLDQQDGIVKQLQTALPTAQKIDATAHTASEQTFATMLAALPPVYRTSYAGMKFYVPAVMRDSYQNSLAGRATTLGDQSLIAGQNTQLAYRGIPIVEVPLLSGTSVINTATVDYGKFAILIHPSNIYVGFHRRVRIERWRDPREMCTYFIPSVRFAVMIADPAAAVLAYNIPQFAMPAGGLLANPFMPWPQLGPQPHQPQPEHVRTQEQQAAFDRAREAAQHPPQPLPPANAPVPQYPPAQPQQPVNNPQPQGPPTQPQQPPQPPAPPSGVVPPARR
jgi:HK97 family phage major capsid protein